MKKLILSLLLFVGLTCLSYAENFSYWGDGSLRAIGDKSVTHWGDGTIRSIGDKSVTYWGDGKIRSIGDESVTYWGTVLSGQ